MVAIAPPNRGRDTINAIAPVGFLSGTSSIHALVSFYGARSRFNHGLIICGRRRLCEKINY
jgi:hypothetical protein